MKIAQLILGGVASVIAAGVDNWLALAFAIVYTLVVLFKEEE